MLDCRKNKALNIRMGLYLKLAFVLFFSINSYSEDLAVGLGVFSPSLAVNVGLDEDSDAIQFKPNNQSNTNLIFSYGNLGLSLGSRNKLSEDKENIPVSTKYNDLQFSFFGGKRNYLVSYQEYTGYYVDNAKDIDGSYDITSTESQFPDMETRSLAFRYYHVFSPEKFDIESAYGISRFQKSSGGSWLLSFGINKDSVKSPNLGMAPSFANSDYDEMKTLREIKMLAFTYQGGYSYTSVYESFFANFIILLGGSIQSQKLEFGSDSDSQDTGSTSGTIGISLGMNQIKHKLNFQVLGVTTQTRIKNNRLSTNLINVGITYAYRFGEKDIPLLKDLSSWFD